MLQRLAGAKKRIELFEGLTREYQRALWVFDNQDRVEFAATPNDDAVDQYEQWINDYEDCINTTIPDVVGQCHDALLAQEEDLCSYCDVPTSCDPSTLSTSATALPEATIVPIIDESERTDSFDLRDGNVTINSDIDRICTLTRFWGKFDDANDYVALTSDPTNDEWTLAVSSSDVNGSMNCADLARFEDSQTDVGGSLDWTTFDFSNTLAGSSSNSYGLGGGTHASAVTGLSGSLRGGGEIITITQGSASPLTKDSMKLDKLTTGAMTGYATTFGTDNPPSNGPLWSTIDLQKSIELDEDDINLTPSGQTVEIAEVKLAPLNESICFLERISGQFDGGGESIKLVQKDNHWHLRVSSGCRVLGSGGFLAQGTFCEDRKDIRATARCYKFDQR